MATQVEEFLDTKAGGFFAGVGIGTFLFVTAYVSGPIIVRAVLPRLLSPLGKKVGEFIVQDVVVGRVPLLNLARPILSVGTIGGTLFTVSFYLFGGGKQLIDMGKAMLGIPIKGTGLPDEDSVTPVRPFNPVLFQQSEFGRVVFVALNGALRDP